MPKRLSSPFHRSALLALAVAGVACNSDLTPPISGVPGAIVRLVFDGHPADTMDVAVTDAASILVARQFVLNGTGALAVSGRIAKGLGYDDRYPFHFIPDSVRLGGVAAAGCDAAPMHSTAEVTAFFQSSTGDGNAASAQWCPSSSRPIGSATIF